MDKTLLLSVLCNVKLVKISLKIVQNVVPVFIDRQKHQNVYQNKVFMIMNIIFLILYPVNLFVNHVYLTKYVQVALLNKIEN